MAVNLKTLTHDPRVLYRSSIERNMGAHLAIQSEDWALGMYLSGLAVECVLQAIALSSDSTYDARHELNKWLSKCPAGLQNTLKSAPMRAHWSLVVTRWDNRLRYLSEDGVLGFLRTAGATGDRSKILRQSGDELLKSADLVHKKGIAAWEEHCKK